MSEENVAVDVQAPTGEPVTEANIDSFVDSMVALQDAGSKKSTENNDDKEEVVNEVEDDEDEEEIVEDEEPTDELDEDDDLDLDDEEEEDTEEDGEPEVKIDDDTVVALDDDTELTIHELKRGFLREQDYTKKTQEVKQVREQAEMVQKRSIDYMTSNLNLYQQAADNLEKQMAGVDTVRLAESDPRAYQQFMAKRDQINGLIKQENDRLTEWNTQYQQTEMDRMTKESEEAVPVIKEAIPDWGPKVVDRILKHASDSGVDKEGLEALTRITDPHIIVSLYKAMRYDAAKSKAQLKRKPAKTKTIKAKSTRDKKTVESKKKRAVVQDISQMNDPEAIADAIARQILK